MKWKEITNTLRYIMERLVRFVSSRQRTVFIVVESLIIILLFAAVAVRCS